MSSSSPRVADALVRGGAITGLPNILSLLRIALVPVVVIVITWPGRPAHAFAGGLVVVAAITDYLDGWLARRHGIATALGQLLDPLADKLLVAAVLIMLAALPPEPRVPAWMAVVIVLREIAVTGLRAIASQDGIVVPADELGKYKLIFQMFALTALLVHYPYEIPGTSLVVDFHAAGMRFLWIALVVSVWSGIEYYVRVLRQVRLD